MPIFCCQVGGSLIYTDGNNIIYEFYIHDLIFDWDLIRYRSNKIIEEDPDLHRDNLMYQLLMVHCLSDEQIITVLKVMYGRKITSIRPADDDFLQPNFMPFSRKDSNIYVKDMINLLDEKLEIIKNKWFLPMFTEQYVRKVDHLTKRKRLPIINLTDYF